MGLRWNMKINDKLHGFTVTNIRQTTDGRFIEMSHDKTAARLAWYDNGDENKLFSVSFKTVPYDNTGVFHILEHSVLGGSEKYPVKEPFLYLLKGSMNTFLNAMTFSDKTMFPVSSRNDADFMNLTSVYLDAVFKPLIYTVPEIFYQEGHHTEYLGEDEKALFKGVVFNEMKGYLSTVHDRIESEMNAMLFPDTSYRFEYGGHPKAIPDLTYDDFIKAHRTFYHPSNSYIYLDGAVDIENVLELIDGYISEYDKCERLPEIEYQQAVEETVNELYYDSSADEDDVPQTYLAVGKILAKWNEREKVTALDILAQAVAGSNDSPLTKALLDTGMCLDVSLSVTDNILQPLGILKFSNIERGAGEALIESAENVVRDLVKNGIGKETIISALNRCEFNYRQSEEPKGLERCVNSMSSWLYGGDPLEYIEMGDVFDSLREKAGSGYFEELLSEWLLDENGRAVLYMMPSETYGEEQNEAERKRVRDSLSAMTDTEKSELIALNRKLAEWQNAPDSSQAVSTLPKLPLSEIDTEPATYKTEEVFDNGVKILKHPAKETEISAIALYFDVNDLTENELKLLTVLDRLISELPTEKYSGIELQNQIYGTLGGLSTDICAFGTTEEPDKCRVMFAVKSPFLTRNADDAMQLIGEILAHTPFGAEDIELARRILRQDEEEMKLDIISNGHRFSVKRMRAHLSAESSIAELVSGYEGCKYLHSVNSLSDSEFADLFKELRSISEKIFCRARLTASTASASELSLQTFIDILPEGEKSSFDKMRFKLNIPQSQGIVIPSSTSCSGAVLSSAINDKAVWNVLSSILSYEYLWNEVRVKGGAYGSSCGVNSMNEVAFNSYCDPSPEASVKIFEDAAVFLKEYCKNEPDISQYIISSISSGEPLMSDGDRASIADGMYFRSITYEDRKKLRSDMLSMTPQKLLSVCGELEKTVYCCITASEEVISSVKSRELETITV